MRRLPPTTALLVVLLGAGCRPVADSAPTSEAAPPEVAAKKDRLAPAVQLLIDGKPLGSGSPALGDIDRDGRLALLLGRDNSGRLTVYRTTGPRNAPRLIGPQWFDSGIPTGRIPAG